MKIYKHTISAATNTTKTKGTTYYLVTFEQIQKYFNGDELVYPEEALDIYTPDELSEYIKPATDAVIQKYITEFELVTPDFDKWAYDIIANNISFSKMVSDYQKFN